MAAAGPGVMQVEAVVLAADTAEHVLLTNTGKWNNPGGQGNMLSFSAALTGAAPGTVTFRIRQGTTVTGTQVGVNMAITTTSGQTTYNSLEYLDSSAYATAANEAGAYVLTYQQSAVSLGTVALASLTLETAAVVA